MVLSYIFSNPVIFLALAFSMLVSLAFHEFSHAWMANYLGDDTAKYAGRLTLNPFAHIDLFGLMLFLFIGFGWGKPVPFNPYNLRNQRYGPALVGIAGPAANMILAVLFGFILRLILTFTDQGVGNAAVQFLFYVVLINVLWMLFNLIPLPPLDGSKVLFAFLPDSMDQIKMQLEQSGPFILFFIIIIDRFIGISIFERLFGFASDIVSLLVGG